VYNYMRLTAIFLMDIRDKNKTSQDRGRNVLGKVSVLKKTKKNEGKKELMLSLWVRVGRNGMRRTRKRKTRVYSQMLSSSEGGNCAISFCLFRLWNNLQP